MSHPIPTHDYSEPTLQGEPDVEECSEGICDGSGFIEEVGIEPDDIRTTRCLCNPKDEEDNLNQD